MYVCVCVYIYIYMCVYIPNGKQKGHKNTFWNFCRKLKAEAL